MAQSGRDLRTAPPPVVPSLSPLASANFRLAVRPMIPIH